MLPSQPPLPVARSYVPASCSSSFMAAGASAAVSTFLNSSADRFCRVVMVTCRVQGRERARHEYEWGGRPLST